MDENGDPSILLPKKKKAKDLKVIGKKRKRMKKEKETKKIIGGSHNYLSSPLTKSSSSGMSGTMSAMFEKHLPLRKRGRAGSIGADST